MPIFQPLFVPVICFSFNIVYTFSKKTTLTLWFNQANPSMSFLYLCTGCTYLDKLDNFSSTFIHLLHEYLLSPSLCQTPITARDTKNHSMHALFISLQARVKNMNRYFQYLVISAVRGSDSGCSRAALLVMKGRVRKALREEATKWPCWALKHR